MCVDVLNVYLPRPSGNNNMKSIKTKSGKRELRLCASSKYDALVGTLWYFIEVFNDTTISSIEHLEGIKPDSDTTISGNFSLVTLESFMTNSGTPSLVERLEDKRSKLGNSHSSYIHNSTYGNKLSSNVIGVQNSKDFRRVL